MLLARPVEVGGVGVEDAVGISHHFRVLGWFPPFAGLVLDPRQNGRLWETRLGQPPVQEVKR